jgi:hypothetical protein
MKKLTIIFILLSMMTIGFSQIYSDSLLSSLKDKITLSSDSLHIILEENEDEYLSKEEILLSISFTIDTFQVEELHSELLDIDYSTTGMVESGYLIETEYDKLLNKYYKLLLDRLRSIDKEKLKVSQRNWVKFRDSERELNQIVSKEEYSGGGTIQRVFTVYQYLDLTKQRVFELYDYLTRITE